MKRGDAFGNPTMMDERPMTCALVDQNELDTRYLAGRLSEAEATAFEEHYFACDRCWGLVKGGAGVRAGLGRAGTAPTVRSRSWWRPLAIAAGIGVVAFGTWRVVAPRNAALSDATRGVGDSLAVQSELSAGLWRARWPAVPEASSYRVRIFAGGGRLLLTREITGTSLDLPADSLSAAAGGTPLYLDVQGFDLLRRPVARSPLVPLQSPAIPR
jgi:hypothetical protein